jgi:ribosomal peptide maturation radical SAM protein 1
VSPDGNNSNGAAPTERFALVVMPVVNFDRPSISTSKLRTVVNEAHGDRLSTEILYPCHDFAVWMLDGPRLGGLDMHQILLNFQHVGLPDWFFRNAAFPDIEDNAAQYFRRYFPGKSPAIEEFKAAILAKRKALPAFLDGLIDKYALDEARIVGFTALFEQNGAVFAMARRLKERNPDITIIIGGANCDSPMGEEIARNVEVIDYVFSGPAVISLPRFIGQFLDGDVEACEQMKGVFTKRFTDREPGMRAGDELDIDVEIPLDYTEFFDSFDQHFSETDAVPQVHLETSRGCWWGERSHCTFCGLNGSTMTYYAMAPDKAIRLFNDLFERYGHKSTMFCTVDNILPKNYVAEVLPHLKTPPGVSIFYEVKANMSPEDLAVMAKAGVRKIQPGIEALSTISLRLMKKGTTAFINLRLLKDCMRFGIEPIWSLLVGFPGEGEEVYEKYVRDLPLVTHLTPPKGVAPIHFDRYSPYHYKADEYGLKLEPVDFYGFCFPFPKESIRNMAYYFTDTQYDAPHFTGIARWLAPMQERLAYWRGRWELDGSNLFESVESGFEGPRLELRREGDALMVFDSRGDETLEFPITPTHLLLLEFLEKDRSLRAIREFGQKQGIDAEAALAFLDAHRLIWAEDERRLGLVMLERSPVANLQLAQDSA